MILLSQIHTASREDARHAEWILERRHPSRWSNTQRIALQVEREVEARLDGHVQREHNALFESIMNDPSLSDEAKRTILEHAASLGEKKDKAGVN